MSFVRSSIAEPHARHLLNVGGTEGKVMKDGFVDLDFYYSGLVSAMVQHRCRVTAHIEKRGLDKGHELL